MTDKHFETIASATNRRQAAKVLDVRNRALLVVWIHHGDGGRNRWIGGTDAGPWIVCRRHSTYCDDRELSIGILSALVADNYDRTIDVEHDPPTSVIELIRSRGRET